MGNNVDSLSLALCLSLPEEAHSPQTQDLLTGGHLEGEIRQRETPVVSPPCVTGGGMAVSPQPGTASLENTSMWVSSSFMK